MAAKRYWRVFLIHNNDTNFCGIGKIQMADTVAGPNLATVAANASASQARAGCEATLAFNGTAPNSDNGWLFGNFGGFNNYGYGNWITYDFGAGNEKDIIELRLAPGTGGVNRSPFSFRFQSSNDNVNFADEWCGVFSGWVNATFTTFSKPAAIPGAASYWGVYGLQTSPPLVAPYFGLANLWFRDGPGGAILSTGGTALASRSDAGTLPANAFDGDPATIWEADGYTDTVSGFLLGYQFAAPVLPAWIDMQNRNDASFQNNLKANNAGEVWASNDGKNWLVKSAYAMPAFVGVSQTQGFAITAPEGAIVDQLVLVSIDFEYELPFDFVRFKVGGVWGFPLWY
jgi:hypothetical protein